MSKTYGNSNESTGEAEVVKKHPGPNPEGTSDEPFSNMRMVDLKEHHLKSIENMAKVPGHVKSIPISQNQAYKNQSHAVKPSGPIKSFTDEKADISSKPKILKPAGGKGYYDGKKQN